MGEPVLFLIDGRSADKSLRRIHAEAVSHNASTSDVKMLELSIISLMIDVSCPLNILAVPMMMAINILIFWSAALIQSLTILS